MEVHVVVANFGRFYRYVNGRTDGRTDTWTDAWTDALTEMEEMRGRI